MISVKYHKKTLGHRSDNFFASAQAKTTIPEPFKATSIATITTALTKISLPFKSFIPG